VATSARIEVLGIFEDRPQAEFVGPLVEVMAPRYGCNVVVEAKLTAGCSFENLNEHLAYANQFSGILIGVDGQTMPRPRKISKLQAACSTAGHVVLWSVACPSIEEWMMADADAMPAALRRLFGDHRVHNAPRPARSRAERTAKRRLNDWVERLLGAPALRGGVEYASPVARTLDPARVGSARNADLKEFLDVEVPAFLRACRSA